MEILCALAKPTTGGRRIHLGGGPRASTIRSLEPLPSSLANSTESSSSDPGRIGGVRPPSPPRHDTTAPEEPFCARGSIRLSLFLYFLIMNLLTRTCLSGFSFISSLPLGFRVGSSLFEIPFVKPILLCEPFILFL